MGVGKIETLSPLGHYQVNYSAGSTVLHYTTAAFEFLKIVGTVAAVHVKCRVKRCSVKDLQPWSLGK